MIFSVWQTPTALGKSLFEEKRLAGGFPNREEAEFAAWEFDVDEPAPDKNSYRLIEVREDEDNA